MRIKQLVIDTVIAGVGILLLAGCSTSSSSSKKNRVSITQQGSFVPNKFAIAKAINSNKTYVWYMAEQTLYDANKLNSKYIIDEILVSKNGKLTDYSYVPYTDGMNESPNGDPKLKGTVRTIKDVAKKSDAQVIAMAKSDYQSNRSALAKAKIKVPSTPVVTNFQEGIDGNDLEITFSNLLDGSDGRSDELNSDGYRGIWEGDRCGYDGNPYHSPKIDGTYFGGLYDDDQGAFVTKVNKDTKITIDPKGTKNVNYAEY
ncbi:hypothetical protein AH70_00715 [Pediococcus damnosus LMG 28219]|uniref:hypothetical protein n=1 Tax=Pediococcus damnosus TaxID=51663 RepID=UPI00061FAF4E|nr:hypothetical protein [Pediococcus damnosus]AMV68887.1 Hypothetical protein ADU73_0479 [Pediococcus damnosus]KJU75072.1 hypothetical protein AH70_00715 [Pediococcus damnosus LMG 28219]PIO80672.1 hypothetical protein BSQ38_02950 [Pediococcus damnosus]PIO85755.1 hypothetical protein BSQ37_07315 [Pediococcus damnosus]